jgi:hypothetical protein
MSYRLLRSSVRQTDITRFGRCLLSMHGKVLKNPQETTCCMIKFSFAGNVRTYCLPYSDNPSPNQRQHSLLVNNSTTNRCGEDLTIVGYVIKSVLGVIREARYSRFWIMLFPYSCFALLWAWRCSGSRLSAVGQDVLGPAGLAVASAAVGNAAGGYSEGQPGRARRGRQGNGLGAA